MSRWRKTPDGRLRTSIGEHGTKVQLFQKRRGGMFYRVVWNPSAQRKEWRSLGTRDPGEALRLGRRLHARLVAGLEDLRGDRVTLGVLWRRFSRECRAYLDNKPASQQDSALRARILEAFFGEGCDVSRLTFDDVEQYRAARLAGGIKVGDRVLKPCRERSVESDLNVLTQMLRWATTVRQKDGSRWLATNPLTGLVRKHERNPRRPVATRERFEATRQAMQDLANKAATDDERSRWLKLELALVLAEGTGRRLGSIRHLQWADFNREAAAIRWRAEYDKKGREDVIPYPSRLFEEVWRLRRALGAAQGWCFAAEKDPKRPMDRHLFDKWLAVAEKTAKLPKLEGGLWHPYRRAWATARKHHSLKDVAAAGGWTDVETLLRCYQQPEKETLLAVTSEKRKVRESASGA